jgi:hypothetical protein
LIFTGHHFQNLSKNLPKNIISEHPKKSDKNLKKTNAVKGLKVALVHHLDMPIMRQTGFHISPGTNMTAVISKHFRRLNFRKSFA